MEIQRMQPNLNKSTTTPFTGAKRCLGDVLFPVSLESRKICYFSSDEKIITDRVCLVRESNVQKTGDIAGPRLQNNKDETWNIYFEWKI